MFVPVLFAGIPLSISGLVLLFGISFRSFPVITVLLLRPLALRRGTIAMLYPRFPAPCGARQEGLVDRRIWVVVAFALFTSFPNIYIYIYIYFKKIIPLILYIWG